MAENLHTRPTRKSMPSNRTEKSNANLVEQNARHQTPTRPGFPTAKLWRRAVVLTLALMVVEALLVQSDKNNGLGPSLPGLYYVWKFGPFTVLSIASGFWNQAADRVKEAEAPCRTSDVRGLNTLVTLGRILFAASVTLSFQLLESQCVKLERRPISLVAHTEFSGAGYDATTVDANPALTIASVYGLGQPWPAGTTDKYAFQSFNAAFPSREVGGMIAGMVDLLEPNLQCEVGSVVNWAQVCSPDDCLDLKMSLTLSTSSCPEYRIVPFEKRSGSAEENFADVVSSSCRDIPEKSTDPQLIFVAARWNDDDPRISSVICSPGYTLSQAHISLHQGNSSTYMVVRFHINDGTLARQIPGVTPAQLSAGFMSTLRNANIFLSEGSNSLSSFSSPNSVHDSSFSRIANIIFPHSSEDLLDPSVLRNVSSQVYTAIIAQVARKYLLHETQKSFEGDSFGSIARIKVNGSFARLLEVSFGVLVFLTLAILARRPCERDVSPRVGE